MYNHLDENSSSMVYPGKVDEEGNGSGYSISIAGRSWHRQIGGTVLNVPPDRFFI
jgi:hypothetical protein